MAIYFYGEYFSYFRSFVISLASADIKPCKPPKYLNKILLFFSSYAMYFFQRILRLYCSVLISMAANSKSMRFISNFLQYMQYWIC